MDGADFFLRSIPATTREINLTAGSPDARALREGSKTQMRKLVRGYREVVGPGDLVWIKESWALRQLVYDKRGKVVERRKIENVGVTLDDLVRDVYLAEKKRGIDHPRYEILYKSVGDWDKRTIDRGFEWQPNEWMPRWVALTELRLMSIHRELIQDINQDDIEAEGFDTIEEFKKYWNRLYRKQNARWDDNPEVLVFSMRLIERKTA